MINIGRGVRQQSSVLKPTNWGMSRIAQERIEQCVGMANAQHLEALEVDGTDAEIWIKQTGGRVCSCQHPKLDTTMSVDSPDIPMNIQISQEENPFNFKLASPRSIRSGGEYNNENIEPLTDIELNGTNNDWVKDFNNDNGHLISSETGLLEQGLSSVLFGGDKSPCSICFGTGWVNGYRLFNGQRVVLDSTLKHKLCGGSINTDDSPYTINLAGDTHAYMEWDNVDVPLYFNEVYFTLYNNLNPMLATILVKPSYDDSAEWKPLSSENLKNVGKAKIDIRIVGEYDKSIQFTHINLVYITSKYPKIDTPSFEKAQDYQFFEALMTTNFELPGSIPYVDRESVIGTAKEGYLWKVSSVNQVMTHQRQIFKCSCQARLIQRSEPLYLLNSMFRPIAVYNYRGLERIQGLSNYIERGYQNYQSF